MNHRTTTLEDCRVTPLNERVVECSVLDSEGDLWYTMWAASSDPQPSDVLMAWERDQDDGVLNDNWEQS